MTRSPRCKVSVVEPPPVEEMDDEEEDSDHSNTDSNSGSGFGAGKIFVTPVKGRGNQGSQRGKYKKKDFTCHHCHKGYCDAARLKDHIESKHEQKNDPWRDVGPNTDIAVRNRAVKEGFEVYKVLGVYSTGLRMKAARFVSVEQNRWRLTEDISKSLMKQDILAVLTSLSQEAGLYHLESSELERLQSLVVSRSQSKLRTTLASEPKTEEVENKDEEEEEEEEGENDMEDEQEFLKQNGLDHEVETVENNPVEEAVMVEPLFHVDAIQPERHQF